MISMLRVRSLFVALLDTRFASYDVLICNLPRPIFHDYLTYHFNVTGAAESNAKCNSILTSTSSRPNRIRLGDNLEINSFPIPTIRRDDW
jgi:hypothetical protein